MITLDAYEVAGIMFIMLVVGLLWAMRWASDLDEPEVDTIRVVWSWEDVRMLRPDLSDDECRDMLFRIADSLHDRSVEVGWDIMDSLIRMESE